MTQGTIVLVFLTGFVGIMLWIIGVIALDILRNNHRTGNKQHTLTEPELHDGYEAHHTHHARQRL